MMCWNETQLLRCLTSHNQSSWLQMKLRITFGYQSIDNVQHNIPVTYVTSRVCAVLLCIYIMCKKLIFHDVWNFPVFWILLIILVFILPVAFLNMLFTISSRYSLLLSAFVFFYL